MQKIRIAWFSPFNNSLSAYVSRCLLPLLRDKFEIELFHNSFDTYEDYPTSHYLQAAFKHKENPYDLFFYQLEDSRCVDFIRTHVGLVPGVVLFHDFLFSTDGPEPILSSNWQAACAKFHNNELPWHDRQTWEAKKSVLPLREAAFTLQALFSNPSNCKQYQDEIGEYTISKADTCYYLPIPVTDFSPFRCDFDGLKIAYTGRPNIEHRAHKLFPAVAGLKSKYKLIWLIDESEEAAASALLTEFFGGRWKDHVELTYGRTPEAWNKLVQSCNTAVHTFFGAYGNTHPYLEISLAHGLPTIVTNFAFAETLPENIVFKVDAGCFESRELQLVFETLEKNRNLTFSQSSVYAKEMFDAHSVADNLACVLEKSVSTLKPVMNKWCDFQHIAHKKLISEVRGFSDILHKGKQDEGIVNTFSLWDQVFAPVMCDLNWCTKTDLQNIASETGDTYSSEG